MNETQIKDLALLLVIKQARARGWDTIHVAPKLRLFLTVPVRDSTVRSQHCPVLRCVWFRKEKLIRDYVSLLAPHVGHTESKDSSCTFHLFLRHQVGKMLPAAVPRTSTPSAMSPVQTSGEV